MIWVILGEKAGDNAQAMRLARALGLPFETKTLALKPAFETRKPAVEASLEPFDLDRSDPLAPPWPDLVLTIGRRLAMAGLWIKSRSPKTKLALIGAPKGRARDFDLIIAALHYRMPEADNVLRIGLPLLVPDPGALSSASETWRPRFANLTRPLTGVFVGGSTGARKFTPADARTFLQQLRDADQSGSGAAFIATSRRTPPEAVAALKSGMPAGWHLYRWRPADPENPYLGLLALADRFVVTGDSISMLVEVARLGRPLAIAPLRQNLLTRILPGRQRDFELLHEFLKKGGWAVRLGQRFAPPQSPGPPDDTERAAARLRSLLRAQDQRSP